ncbi:HTH-type transcriptional regulator GntR [Comamonas composti]|uniref:LacI family DNA-binding transcriptional regulator n=1 Tax=Comamonas composti TaxID=408558 RepID=UPI00040F36F9|nr:LacI family DNA-binding transcriptional regulator [Comamonas composti]
MAHSSSESPLPAPAAGRTRSSRATGRITLADVAQACGVSAMTVSRALRGERRVAPGLVEKIRAAADELGYVPDPAARALASQKSSQVLVLVPMLSNTLFVDLLEAVHQVLFKAGYQALIGVTHYDTAEEELLLRTYLPLRPAGLLLTGLNHSPGAEKLLAASKVPCVHLMELSDRAGTPCVGFSQTDAGADITRHLLAGGRRRIVFCAGQLDVRVMQRAEGYRNALREAGVYDQTLELLWPQPTSMALGAQLFNAALALKPDAMFFCNDDIAQGALLEALRLGIDVPGQVALAGFNDLAGSDQMLPPLTTIRTPRQSIGREAAQMLLQLMRGDEVEQTRIDLGYELIVRKSS